jgi:threonine aldolase
VLLGAQEFINACKRLRKLFGGGWRQAGYLAAAGLYALENNVARLADDHRAAAQLAEALRPLPYVAEILEPETNLLIFRLDESRLTVADFLARLEAQGIKASGFGGSWVRFVTHLDVSEEMLARVMAALPGLAA